MTEVLILPTLEPLRPYGKEAFGAVFSLALRNGTLYEGDALAEWLKAFLTPWSWEAKAPKLRRVTRFKVYFIEGDGSLWTELPEEPRAESSTAVTAVDPLGLAALKTRLGDRFRCFGEQGGDPWQWQRKGRVDRAVRPWPAFLAQLSLLPWPLPQALGLSSFLKIKGVPGSATRLVAAPVLQLGDDGGNLTILPGPPEEGRDSQVELRYPPIPNIDLTLVAVTVPFKLKAPPSSKYIDLSSLWIKKGSPEDAATEDWRSDLEARLAVELDMARLTIDRMREKRTAEGAATALRQLREKTTPCLAEASSLLRKAAARRRDSHGRPFSEETICRLCAKAQPWFDSGAVKAQWITWVKDATAGQGEAPRILEVEESRLSSLTPDETIAQLDHLAAALASPKVAAMLFHTAWERFLGDSNNQPIDDAEADLAKSLAVEMPGRDLQYGLEMLRARVVTDWKNALDEVFAVNGSMEDCRAKLASKLADNPVTKGKARQIAEAVFPKTVNALDVDKATNPPEGRIRGTRGITSQVDTLGGDPGDSDLLQEMQGVALLLRRVSQNGKGAWRCLNMARASIGSQPISDRVLLPSRLVYLEGLRAPTLTYDDQPLTVAGPLAEGSAAGTSIEPGEIEVNPLDPPLIDFSYSKSERMPELIFGESYELAAFVITNSGAIPEELSDPQGKPWQLNQNIQSLSKTVPFKDIIRAITYQREASVGALRLKVPQPGLPPIPSRVAPRLRELPAETVLPPRDPLLRQPTSRQTPELQTDSALAGVPLVLLAAQDPKESPFVGVADNLSFAVLPPTVDLLTWERWVAAVLDKSWRKLVWTTYYKLVYEQGERKDPESLENAGIYLTDPAVGGLWAELVGIPEEGKPVQFAPVVIDFNQLEHDPSGPPPPNELEALVKFQKHGGDVVFSFENGNLKASFAGKSFNRPQGDNTRLRMFRFSVYAWLKNEGASRFRWWSHEVVRHQGSYSLTSPWHLLIEVPQPLPTKNPKINQALRAALEPTYDKKSGLVQVNMDLDAKRRGDLEELRGHIYRAQIWHQVWHWRGRPPADHSKIFGDHPPVDDLIQFEMSEFGERRDDEHRRLPMKRMGLSKDAEVAFLYEENLAAQGPQGDFRALYHRYSARVFSRYEGLLRQEHSHLDAVDEEAENRWQGRFVPCRHLGDVPAPKVRLVLPLTQGPDKERDGPGLLVVVDGPWYEVGGLVEALDVEVMPVSGPEVETGKEDKAHTYFQAGTDPIITGSSAREAFESRKPGALAVKDYTVKFSSIVGAVGHHREATDADPRFLASSFLLARPTITRENDPNPRPVDLTWWFLKLRFRRSLKAVEGMTGANVSEWSAPFWVQLLPGVERVEEDWFESQGELTVKFSGQALVVSPGKLIKREDFHLFAVMTRKVVDFSGRPDQEAYLGVWSPDSTGGWHGPDPGTKKDLYVRFLEVQSKQGLPGEDLWERIFTANQPDPQRARIVRISKRFTVNGGAQ